MHEPDVRNTEQHRSRLTLLDSAAEVYAIAKFYADEGDHDLLNRVRNRIVASGLTEAEVVARIEARGAALRSEMTTDKETLVPEPASFDRAAVTSAARARAHSVRNGSPTPPAWATKAGEDANWRRAALILAHDILSLTREASRAN